MALWSEAYLKMILPWREFTARKLRQEDRAGPWERPFLDPSIVDPLSRGQSQRLRNGETAALRWLSGGTLVPKLCESLRNRLPDAGEDATVGVTLSPQRLDSEGNTRQTHRAPRLSQLGGSIHPPPSPRTLVFPRDVCRALSTHDRLVCTIRFADDTSRPRGLISETR